MRAVYLTFFSFILPFILITRASSQKSKIDFDKNILPGAYQVKEYLPLLKGKRVAIVANQTSTIRKTHLVDSLLALKVNITKVFAPEHGFRGQAGAGEEVGSSIDTKTKLPLISLYGKQLKPSQAELQNVDVVVFDIQDVGVRFYTYISTLQYVMEACAEKKIPCIVLDRPNPNGFYVDGPVLEKEYASFVGLNPVPIVYGLTIGEYAGMLNGEHWLSGGLQCDLKVIKVKGYDHTKYYKLPIKPSPNLPDMAAVYLYPSLCLFEGTAVSVGRGTPYPFQVIGYPGFSKGSETFTPRSIPGAAVHPPYEGKECNGIRLTEFGEMFLRDYKGIYLFWIKSFYDTYTDKPLFFNDFFNKLAGNSLLQQQIKEGKGEEEIKLSWKTELESFKITRRKYLLYKDFN